MASYQSISKALDALKAFLELFIDDDLDEAVTNPRVTILGSQDLKKDPSGNNLGVYLHRISVDPYGRNRPIPSRQTLGAVQPELPVNLHVLLIGWCSGRIAEQLMLGWGMQVLGGGTVLDSSSMASLDVNWGGEDMMQVIPEDMSTEDLMRIWDGLPHDYVLSTPYILKTIRLEPVRERDVGPDATGTVFSVGVR